MPLTIDGNLDIAGLLTVGTPPLAGENGIFLGGVRDQSFVTRMSGITISSLGNASFWGTLQEDRALAGGASNGVSRGVLGGGWNPAGQGTYINIIDYITFSDPYVRSSTDFGDLTLPRYRLMSTANGITDRAIFGGGQSESFSSVNLIDYITISSIGNASAFGDHTEENAAMTGTSNASNDRGIIAGFSATIGYVTISSLGDAADFGDLTSNRAAAAATSNGINERGIVGGGAFGGRVNIIEYITISSIGNAGDFGDLLAENSELAAMSNGTSERGVFGGGLEDPGPDAVNRIQYVTISSLGNSADFGDLSADSGPPTAGNTTVNGGAAVSDGAP